MDTHDLVRHLTGWRQTTAEILYRMPDYPVQVESAVWQEVDQWYHDQKLTLPRLRRLCEW
jgi:uncharacterized protein Usg